MASIVRRGMLPPGAGLLWVSSVECRSWVACGVAVGIVESPTPGFFEFPLSLGEAPATYPERRLDFCTGQPGLLPRVSLCLSVRRCCQ